MLSSWKPKSSRISRSRVELVSSAMASPTTMSLTRKYAIAAATMTQTSTTLRSAGRCGVPCAPASERTRPAAAQLTAYCAVLNAMRHHTRRWARSPTRVAAVWTRIATGRPQWNSMANTKQVVIVTPLLSGEPATSSGRISASRTKVAMSAKPAPMAVKSEGLSRVSDHRMRVQPSAMTSDR